MTNSIMGGEASPGHPTWMWRNADESPERLKLSAEHDAELRRLAEVSYPFEACGLLIGDGESGRVEQVVHALNLDQTRAQDRYLLDPEDFLAADCAARGQGLEIVGIWHSHPDSAAVPSAVDLEAAWHGYSYVIVAVDARGRSVLRSWRLEGEQFQEQTVLVR